MLEWFFRKYPPQSERILICMRLDEMHRVHPDQIEAKCSKCNETVGIFPSGQRVLKEVERISIVCNHCAKPDHAILAPGAEREARESIITIPRGEQNK
jgi:hypothetical protein